MFQFYNPVALNVQQSTYIWVVTGKTFRDRSDIDDDTYVVYEGVVLRDGHPDNTYVLRERRNLKFNIYMHVDAPGYWGTTVRSYIHLPGIEQSQYVQLNELFTGCIADEYPGVHHGNDGNSVVGGYVNVELFENPNMVPHVDILNANIATRFGHKIPRL